jgi:hypothetical protein
MSVLPQLAVAAVPIALPAGEDAGDWGDAFMMTGLEAGQPGAGEGAWLVPVPDGWLLKVRDRSGAIRSATVGTPSGAADREEIAWLAISLLQPVAQPVLPVEDPRLASADPPAVVAVAPKPVAARPVRPAPKPEEPAPPAPAPDPEPVAPVPAPVVAPAPEPMVIRLAVGPALQLHPDIEASLGGQAHMSLRLPGGVWSGISGEVWTGAPLSGALPGEVGGGAARVAGGMSWDGPLAQKVGAPRVGLSLGLAPRVWREAEESVTRALIPTAGLVVDATWTAWGDLGVTATAMLQADLRAIRVRAEDANERLSPVGLVLSLSPSWTGSVGSDRSDRSDRSVEPVVAGVSGDSP